MPAALLAKALGERLHELVPTAERLDPGLLVLGQHALERLAQPVRRDVLRESGESLLRALEMRSERPVVAVVVFLVLHQRRAREVVEAIDVLHGDARIERGQ